MSINAINVSFQQFISVYTVSLTLPVEHVPGEEHQMSETSGLFVEKPQSVAVNKGEILNHNCTAEFNLLYL